LRSAGPFCKEGGDLQRNPVAKCENGENEREPRTWYGKNFDAGEGAVAGGLPEIEDSNKNLEE